MTDARSIVSVALVALGCAALLGITAQLTAGRIEANEADHRLAILNELAGGALTPELLAAASWQYGVLALCDGSSIVRTTVAGYAAPIELLVAVTTGEPRTVKGLRVTAHRETPGIADFLNQPDSGWMQTMENRNLNTLQDVDAVSGATISSNAVLRALGDALPRAAALPRGDGSRTCDS